VLAGFTHTNSTLNVTHKDADLVSSYELDPALTHPVARIVE
jgi:hypothetical protein